MKLRLIALASALLLGGALTGYAVYQEMTATHDPDAYILPTYPRVQKEVETLRAIIRSGRFSSTRMAYALRRVASSNKKGVHVRTDEGDAVVDEQESATDAAPASPASSGDADSTTGLRPGIPSIGYTVGLYTYAGFEPSKFYAHENVTDPKIAGKYALYRYLVNNNIDPNTNWAETAAAELNKQFGQEFYHGKGQLLEYGTQFVRSAPNGWGLLNGVGAYDTAAQGEFFWSMK